MAWLFLPLVPGREGHDPRLGPHPVPFLKLRPRLRSNG
jgi:hypothetical protein